MWERRPGGIGEVSAEEALASAERPARAGARQRWAGSGWMPRWGAGLLLSKWRGRGGVVEVPAADVLQFGGPGLRRVPRSPLSRRIAGLPCRDTC